MAHEIERKFLVVSDGWKTGVTGSRRLRDGLVARFGNGKVRVRLDQDRGLGWITVKGPRTGPLCRAEFEYEIPGVDAEEMLRTLCDEPAIQKTRFLVPHANLTWEVDVHEGPLAGLALADVELEHEGQEFALPGWVGREVTGDPAYRTTALLKRCAEGLLARSSP